MAKLIRIISLGFLLLVICSCSQSKLKPVPASTKVDLNMLLAQATQTVTAPNGSVVGRVVSITQDAKPLANTIIRLAPIQYDENNNPLGWVLEGGTSPGAITDGDGYFSINNITAKDYVMIVGDITAEYYVMLQSDGKHAVVYTIQPGQVLSLDKVEAAFPLK